MPKLIYSNTKDSDMRYIARANITDPFFFLDNDSEQYVFLDLREHAYFQEKNNNPELKAILVNDLYEKAKQLDEKTSLRNKLALLIFDEYGLSQKCIEVPASFPLDLADYLRSKGFELKVKAPFFPERLIKSTEEIEQIKDSLAKTKPAFERIEQVLADAIIMQNQIFYKGRLVTSELLKQEVQEVLSKTGMANLDGIIISSAGQAAIPHHPGGGPILPNETIVADIFPASLQTGYHADMTRTYVKGEASEAITKMYFTVAKVQEKIINLIKPGITAGELYKIACDEFIKAGYDCDNRGFTHALGHGIGLDVHEAPILGAISQHMLEPGNVITIEPGLYYPELGGVRIEDVVVVTANGCKDLTDYRQLFIIK